MMRIVSGCEEEKELLVRKSTVAVAEAFSFF
jgi:hypothetical protein